MAFFDKFKQGMNKTRSFILENILSTQEDQNLYLNEEQIDELEMTLMRTDMGADCVDELMNELRERLENDRISLKDVLDFLSSKIREILGESQHLRLNPNRLNIILMVGVNGSGKTTTAGKLAKRWIDEGNKVLLAAADTFRAAAIDQLKYWADKTGADFVSQHEGADPAAVVFDAIKAAKARNCNAVIVDTAGRLQNKKNLMQELQKIRRVIDKEAAGNITKTIIVIDGTSGQNAVIQAQQFTEVCRVDGICISKLDGSAKGGVAVAVTKTTSCRINLVGLGEGADDLVDFDPIAFTSSLLPEYDEIVNNLS